MASSVVATETAAAMPVAFARGECRRLSAAAMSTRDSSQAERMMAVYGSWLGSTPAGAHVDSARAVVCGLAHLMGRHAAGVAEQCATASRSTKSSPGHQRLLQVHILYHAAYGAKGCWT